MCIASVRDCRALAAAQPVDVTRARIPWFINSHAGRRKEKNRGKGGNEERMQGKEDGCEQGYEEIIRMKGCKGIKEKKNRKREMYGEI